MRHEGPRTVDAAIVGGGFAGLAAAIWLRRFRRTVCILDTDSPRSEATWAVHGFPGLPDLPPLELRRRMRDQALGTGTETIRSRASELTGGKDEFVIQSEAGAHAARRVLLAYGRQDSIPDIPGSRELFGRALFHCPDCDGPSMSGARVAVLGHNRSAGALALYLLTWAREVELLTNGRGPELDDAARATLNRHDVRIITDPVGSMLDRAGGGARLVLRAGDELNYDGVFTHPESRATSDLAERAGCGTGPDGRVVTDASGQTSVSGVFAAGDLTGPPYLAICAAAEGVTAALTIHRSLLPGEFEL